MTGQLPQETCGIASVVPCALQAGASLASPLRTGTLFKGVDNGMDDGEWAVMGPSPAELATGPSAQSPCGPPGACSHRQSILATLPVNVAWRPVDHQVPVYTDVVCMHAWINHAVPLLHALDSTPQHQDLGVNATEEARVTKAYAWVDAHQLQSLAGNHLDMNWHVEVLEEDGRVHHLWGADNRVDVGI